MDSAFAWRRYYTAERRRMGDAALRRLIDDAAPLAGPRPRAIVVPHTRLEVTGAQIATAVATVVESGADRVLALGVLHGGRRVDRDEVALARAGDPSARRRLRGVHDESGLASEEFSLDGFRELLHLAVGDDVDLVARYPFLVGDDPAGLPGIEELEALVDRGAFLVVTTDPVHHGHAYGTRASECLDPAAPATLDRARSVIGDQLRALSEHRFGEFAELTERHRSDFRDTGPVMAHLVGRGFEPTVHDLALVDYAAALDAPSPTWVAGALVTI